MSRARFRVNLHSIVAWISRNYLLKKRPVWLNGWLFVYELSGSLRSKWQCIRIPFLPLKTCIVIFNNKKYFINVFNAFRYKGAVFRNLLNIEAAARRCSKNLVFLNILQNSLENTCTRVSFLRKLQVSGCNFIKKETLPQVFFTGVFLFL